MGTIFKKRDKQEKTLQPGGSGASTSVNIPTTPMLKEIDKLLAEVDKVMEKVDKKTLGNCRC